MSEREQVKSARTIWCRKRCHAPSLTSRFTFHVSRPVLRNERGFTFIEIMVVVAILAILAALVIPRIMGRTDDAKRTAKAARIARIATTTMISMNVNPRSLRRRKREA